MAFALKRQDHAVNTADPEATRAWLLGLLRLEVKARAQPLPRILLVWDDHAETLDLDAVTRGDPGAHPGATFQALRARGAPRRFLILRLTAAGPDDGPAPTTFTAVFEERDTDDGRRWWLAILPYTVDPRTGLGVPARDWESGGETGDPTQLWPLFRPFAAPPPGARAAAFAPPEAPEDPRVRYAFGELAAALPLPENARGMAQFALELVGPELLAGAVAGTVVVRLAGRAWEQWVFPHDIGAPTDELCRYVANMRPPMADAVALVNLAIRPHEEPPVPGIQVVAERSGEVAECWGPLAFPDGPEGRPEVPRVAWWDPQPVREGGLWLGLPSLLQFEEAVGTAEA